MAWRSLEPATPQLLSDATLVNFQTRAPEGSDAGVHWVPGPALAKGRLPRGADMPRARHLPPESLEVSEMGKQGARVKHRRPMMGDPDLEHVGLCPQGGANKGSPWGPEKEGRPGSVPDPQGRTPGRGEGRLSERTNYFPAVVAWRWAGPREEPGIREIQGLVLALPLCPQVVVLGAVRPLGPALRRLLDPEAKGKVSSPDPSCLEV